MRHAPAKRDSRGFTLLELLVVLLIMGLFVGLVSTVVRPDDRGRLRVEAERLAQLLDLAVEESRLTGRPIAWTGDVPGYRFWRMDENTGWIEVHDSDLLHRRNLPPGMRIAGLRVEDMPARDAMRLEFAPWGMAPSFSIELSLGDARLTVSASPTGEIRVLPSEGA